jgi:enoyl-CoA hydratase/carnithine racemase
MAAKEAIEMTNKPLFITEVSPSYWRVTFNNPPLNMVGNEMLLALHDVVERMDASEDLKVVVFDSAVDDYFLDHYELGVKNPIPLPTYESGLTALPDFSTRVERAPYVTIAVIRGRTRAVGSEIALAMDMRFASLEKAVFSQPEVGLGVLPGGGALERLPVIAGRARTLEIVAGADDYDAATAERYGWVNRASGS